MCEYKQLTLSAFLVKRRFSNGINPRQPHTMAARDLINDKPKQIYSSSLASSASCSLISSCCISFGTSS